MEDSKEIAKSKSGPGEGIVGRIGIVLIMAYLILLFIFLLYSLIQFWPFPTSAGTSNSSLPLTFPWSFLSISNKNVEEIRVLLFVALAGAMGSLVHALRSFYIYVGNRELKWSWLAMYILLPFIGATLGLVFYLIIRGGLLSPQLTTAGQINSFGFAALAALVGLFSNQAIHKLKEVAETTLSKPEKEKDTISTKSDIDKKK